MHLRKSAGNLAAKVVGTRRWEQGGWNNAVGWRLQSGAGPATVQTLWRQERLGNWPDYFLVAELNLRDHVHMPATGMHG